MLEVTQHAARIQAAHVFPDAKMPQTTDSLWIRSEAMNWAYGSTNKTATSANPDFRSPYEMWHGKPATLPLLPFLKLGFFHKERERKSEPKRIPCYYLGPVHNRPAGAMRVLNKVTRSIMITRDVTWITPVTPDQAFKGGAPTASALASV